MIGSVLIPGAAAPKLVTDEMVAAMRPGAVLVDIAIDQGGCFEGSRPTTHDAPTFAVHDAIFYCVANMPGAVPRDVDPRAHERDAALRARRSPTAGWKAARRTVRRCASGSTRAPAASPTRVWRGRSASTSPPDPNPGCAGGPGSMPALPRIVVLPYNQRIRAAQRAEHRSKELCTVTTPANTGSALWSAQAHMPSVLGRQLVIARGEGNYVFTTDGQRLFDGTAGLWHANIGHGREEMAEAAAQQMRTLETYHVFGRYLNDRAVELAEKVASISPIADAKIILNSGGSDSIDVALKLARRYWQLQGAPRRR